MRQLITVLWYRSVFNFVKYAVVVKTVPRAVYIFWAANFSLLIRSYTYQSSLLRIEFLFIVARSTRKLANLLFVFKVNTPVLRYGDKQVTAFYKI